LKPYLGLSIRVASGEEVVLITVISVEYYPATTITEWLPETVNEYGRAARLIWILAGGLIKYQATFAGEAEFDHKVVDGLLIVKCLSVPLGVEQIEPSDA
jgi:hypothetical protein